MHLRWNTTYGDNTEFVQFPNRILYYVCNRKCKRISLNLTFISNMMPEMGVGESGIEVLSHVLIHSAVSHSHWNSPKAGSTGGPSFSGIFPSQGHSATHLQVGILLYNPDIKEALKWVCDPWLRQFSHDVFKFLLTPWVEHSQHRWERAREPCPPTLQPEDHTWNTG